MVYTWHNYGYGVCTDKITVASVEKMEALLGRAPKYRQRIHDWFADCKIAEPTVDDYLDSDQDFGLGLAAILKEVILEAEGVELTACDDFNGMKFLIYEPLYPWQMTEKDLGLTEEGPEQLFRKYVSLLTEEDIEIDYQSVENGG